MVIFQDNGMIVDLLIITRSRGPIKPGQVRCQRVKTVSSEGTVIERPLFSRVLLKFEKVLAVIYLSV
jgi:hypothetical protein